LESKTDQGADADPALAVRWRTFAFTGADRLIHMSEKRCHPDNKWSPERVVGAIGLG
jgi:hypothetical protein